MRPSTSRRILAGIFLIDSALLVAFLLLALRDAGLARAFILSVASTVVFLLCASSFWEAS